MENTIELYQEQNNQNGHNPLPTRNTACGWGSRSSQFRTPSRVNKESYSTNKNHHGVFDYTMGGSKKKFGIHCSRRAT